MIKFLSDNGKCKLEASGKLDELCADVTLLIHEVHDGLEGEVRKAFKYAMKEAVKDGICFASEEKEKKDEEKSKSLEEIFEELEKLKDLLMGKKK